MFFLSASSNFSILRRRADNPFNTRIATNQSQRHRHNPLNHQDASHTLSANVKGIPMVYFSGYYLWNSCPERQH